MRPKKWHVQSAINETCVLSKVRFAAQPGNSLDPKERRILGPRSSVLPVRLPSPSSLGASDFNRYESPKSTLHIKPSTIKEEANEEDVTVFFDFITLNPSFG